METRFLRIISEPDDGRSTLLDYLCSLSLEPPLPLFDPPSDTLSPPSFPFFPQFSVLRLPYESEADEEEEHGLKDKEEEAMTRQGKKIRKEIIINVKTAWRVERGGAEGFLSDGFMLLLDCQKGLSTFNHLFVRESLLRGSAPSLFLNKLDQLLLSHKNSNQEIYEHLLTQIERVNDIISAYQNPLSSPSSPSFSSSSSSSSFLSPVRGNVLFGSGLQCWAFSLNQFSKAYSRKFGVDEKRMLERLWGDHFFNPETKKWTQKPSEGAQRGFNLLVLQTLEQIVHVAENPQNEELDRILAKIGVDLPEEERKERPNRVFEGIMRRFLPLQDAFCDMVRLHLPSPLQGQPSRLPLLYHGPLDDPFGQSISQCDPKGPLAFAVAQVMLPSNTSREFFVLGRIFSGTVRQGETLWAQAPVSEATPSLPPNAAKVKGIFIPGFRRHFQPLPACPSGHLATLCLEGSPFLLSGRRVLTDVDIPCPLFPFKPFLPRLFSIKVLPEQPEDLPRLIQELKTLPLTNPQLEVEALENGDHVIRAPDLPSLKEIILGPKTRVEGSFTSFRETILGESDRVCLAKSPNMRNRVYMKAEPLGEEATKEIEAGRIKMGPPSAHSQLAEQLSQKTGRDVTSFRDIWCFGPENGGPNLLVKRFLGSVLPKDRDLCLPGFQWATKNGVLCQEEMRGCQFNVYDVVFHTNAISSGEKQMIPTIRRAVHGSFLTAKPTLLEPIGAFELAFQEQQDAGTIYSLFQKHGVSYSLAGGPKCNILKAEGFLRMRILDHLLSGLTQRVHLEVWFDHWEPVSQLGLEDGELRDIIRAVRRAKGLTDEVPDPVFFHDRI